MPLDLHDKLKGSLTVANSSKEEGALYLERLKKIILSGVNDIDWALKNFEDIFIFFINHLNDDEINKWLHLLVSKNEETRQSVIQLSTFILFLLIYFILVNAASIAASHKYIEMIHSRDR